LLIYPRRPAKWQSCKLPGCRTGDPRPPCSCGKVTARGGKVKNRTLANLSSWPEAKVEALARALKGLPPAGLDGAFEIARSLPHGHVAAVLGTIRDLGLQELIAPEGSRPRDLVTAMITAAVIDGSSKLATARGLRAQTAARSLGEVLGLQGCDEDDLYGATDWLGPRQEAIEDALAARHLVGGTLVLYDVSSAAFEGRTCPLGAIGHARDRVRGRLQIVYGVLTTTAGIPVAVEVFKGNTGDPATLASQVTKLKQRFGLAHLAVAGDRGMLTKARIRDDLQPAELDWITALRGPAIKALISQGAIQPTLFDETAMAEITSPDYPGEQLVACCNPFLAVGRARKRGELLQAAEAELAKIDAATRRARRPLRGKDAIGLAAGKVINAKKVAKHFITDIGEDGLSWRRVEDKIAAEAALDGIYVVRTSLPRRRARRGQRRGVLQGPGKRRAGVPRAEYRPADPAHPAPARRPGQGPRADPDAGLLRDLAHAAAARADAVQRRRPRRRARGPVQPGRPRPPLTRGTGQSRHQGHRRRRADA
jgi:hypothetical protein